MKDCLSLPGLGWKNFNSLRTDEDEPIYTYNDKYVRWFLRQSLKRGRVCAFKQYYESKSSDDFLKNLSEEFDVKGNFYDIVETSLLYKNIQLKVFEKK